jgi:hypothetical protein
MPYKDPEVAKAKAHERYMRNRDVLYAKSRAYVLEHPEQNRAYKRAAKRRLRDWLDSIKREAGCVDCGTHEGRLDFDHRPDTVKLFNPARLDRGRKALEAEIAKCDVRCVSCHMRRHWPNGPVKNGVVR